MTTQMVAITKPSAAVRDAELVFKNSAKSMGPLKLRGAAKRWHPDRTRDAAEPFVLYVIQRELERGGDDLVGIGIHIEIEVAS